MKVIFKQSFVIDAWGGSHKITLSWMSQDLIDDKPLPESVLMQIYFVWLH